MTIRTSHGGDGKGCGQNGRARMVRMLRGHTGAHQDSPQIAPMRTAASLWGSDCHRIARATRAGPARSAHQASNHVWRAWLGALRPRSHRALAQSARPASLRLWRRRLRVRVCRPGHAETPQALFLAYAQGASILRGVTQASSVQVHARAQHAPLATSQRVSEQRTVRRAYPGCTPVQARPIALAGRALQANSARPVPSKRICALRAQWGSLWKRTGRRAAKCVFLANFLRHRALQVARPALLANLPFPAAPRGAAHVHLAVSSHRLRSQSRARRAHKAKVIRTVDDLATSACQPVYLASAFPLLSVSLYACWRS